MDYIYLLGLFFKLIMKDELINSNFKKFKDLLYDNYKIICLKF